MSIFAGLSSLGPEDGTVGPGGYHCLVWMSHQTKLWHTTAKVRLTLVQVERSRA